MLSPDACRKMGTTAISKTDAEPNRETYANNTATAAGNYNRHCARTANGVTIVATKTIFSPTRYQTAGWKDKLTACDTDIVVSHVIYTTIKQQQNRQRTMIYRTGRRSNGLFANHVHAAKKRIFPCWSTATAAAAADATSFAPRHKVTLHTRAFHSVFVRDQNATANLQHAKNRYPRQSRKSARWVS